MEKSRYGSRMVTLDRESEHFLSWIVAMKSNSDLGWKLTICVNGLGVNFVRSSSLCGSHNVSPVASLFCCLLRLVTLNLPLDSIYYLILKQRHENISILQERWPSPLVSAARYASEAHTLSELAAFLSGSPNTHTLQWLSPVVCELPSDSHASEVDDLETILDVELEDPGQITLTDHLLDNITNDMEGSENKDEDEKDPMRISVDWQIPSVRVVTPI